MPSLTLANKVIWFAHCPKAGGTSIEQVMVARWGDAVGHLHWGWDLWWKRGGWRVADPPNSPQHLTWHDAQQSLPQKPDVVFSVVRDPVARMASEYRWQATRRRGTRLGRWVAKLPFPFWLRLMLATAARNPHAFDNHFRAQADFVPFSAIVFRLEDGLHQVVEWLCETTETSMLETPVPHAIATRKMSNIDPRDAALIGTVFAIDYERFGYSRPASGDNRCVLDLVASLFAPLVLRLERCGLL